MIRSVVFLLFVASTSAFTVVPADTRSSAVSTRLYLDLPADDPRQRCPDIDLAKQELGWKPTVNLETGLARTIEWFRENL